jgi:hypothetical protein
MMSRFRLATVVITGLLLAACDGDSDYGGFRPEVGVGDQAPPSHNLVVADAKDWHAVSTMDRKVDLYRWEIADLIAQGKPFLVVFGTPQHCTMCVDQIVRVAVMQEKYGDRFAFIHVDGYKDNTVWVEWGVKGEPWTFFVDAKGKVRSVYPGQTELDLLEQEVQELLGESA